MKRGIYTVQGKDILVEFVPVMFANLTIGGVITSPLPKIVLNNLKRVTRGHDGRVMLLSCEHGHINLKECDLEEGIRRYNIEVDKRVKETASKLMKDSIRGTKILSNGDDIDWF